MCKIVTAKNVNEIIQAAQIGLDSCLYIPLDYCHIFKFLKQVIEKNSPKIIYGRTGWLKGEIVKLSIAYENETPAGICLMIKYKNHYIIEIFVKENFRKRGIGGNLIRNSINRIKKTIYVFKTSSWKNMNYITDFGIKIFPSKGI